MPDATPPTPLVSVVMPAYNAEATIEQAMDSVWAQAYPHVELLVVDDGSSDSTVALVQQAQIEGRPVQLWQQANQGPAVARNLALRHVRGDLIAFLDADDVWLPGKLQAQVAYLQAHPETDVVFGRFERWEADAQGRFDTPPTEVQPQPGLTQPSGSLYADLLLDSVVHIITALVRKRVLDRVGVFDTTLFTGEDYDFWLRVSWQHRIDQLAQTVAWYRIHPASVTKRLWPHSAEYQVLRKHLAQHGATGPDGRTVPQPVLNKRLFGICFGHGYHHFWHGSPWVAFKAYAEATRHHPWAWKTWAYCVLSLLRVPFSWVARRQHAT